MNNDLITQDCLFPTDNDLEIPALRLDRQPRVADIPFLAFGEQKRTHDMLGNGTLHFYVDDYRFQTVYDHPEKILAMHPRNIVEPNFSLFNETPVAFGLQAIYKKRQVARLMQENGLGVFVDLNVSAKFYKLNLLGVPAGYGAFCTRGYSDRIPYLEFEYRIAKMVAGDNPLLFVVYGGGAECQRFCREVGAVYVTPVIVIKNKIKAMKKIEENVAFHQLRLGNAELQEKIDELYANQVLDYAQKPLLDKP